MPLFRLLVFASLISGILGGTHSYAHLDKGPNIELSHECSIAGHIHREKLTLNGSFYDCSEPPGPAVFNCTISPYEAIANDSLNIHCVAPSDSVWFHNQKICSFRFFSRKMFCKYDYYDCYRMALTCWPVFRPKIEFYFAAFFTFAFVFFGILGAGQCWYVKRYRAREYDFKKARHQLDLLRARSGHAVIHT